MFRLHLSGTQLHDAFTKTRRRVLHRDLLEQTQEVFGVSDLRISGMREMF
jgi:hypothetical protein